MANLLRQLSTLIDAVDVAEGHRTRNGGIGGVLGAAVNNLPLRVSNVAFLSTTLSNSSCRP